MAYQERFIFQAHQKKGELRDAAERWFQKRFLKLLQADGETLLRASATLDAAGITDGDTLTALALQAEVTATGDAYAAWCSGDGRVIAWGSGNLVVVAPQCSTCCTAFVRSTVAVARLQLYWRNVQLLLGAAIAMAVTTAQCAVQDQLKEGQAVRGTAYAFAALLSNGSVALWGQQDLGGDSSQVQAQLHDVQCLFSSERACGAVLANRSVVAWGMDDHGGDSSSAQQRPDGKVTHIAATRSAFAAILVDGSVVTWGCFEEGGDASEVQSRLQNVAEIEGNGYAFAARLVDGSVVPVGEQLAEETVLAGNFPSRIATHSV
eukprot:s504_g26.t1